MIKLLLLVSLCGLVIGAVNKTAVFLEAHNEARADFLAKPLKWSHQLYPVTLKRAKTCTFDQQRHNGTYGENVYATEDHKNISAIIKDAMKDWMDQDMQYNSKSPEVLKCGAFTQVVWKSTTHVACASHSCAAGTILDDASTFIVCHYNPSGNKYGEFKKNVALHTPGKSPR